MYRDPINYFDNDELLKPVVRQKSNEAADGAMGEDALPQLDDDADYIHDNDDDDDEEEDEEDEHAMNSADNEHNRSHKACKYVQYCKNTYTDHFVRVSHGKRKIGRGHHLRGQAHGIV